VGALTQQLRLGWIGRSDEVVSAFPPSTLERAAKSRIGLKLLLCARVGGLIARRGEMKTGGCTVEAN